MPSHLQISRRCALRGLGVSLALPWLEAMRPVRAAETAQPPIRVAFLFVPGGVNVDEWMPDGEGVDYQTRFTLDALAPVRDHVLVLSQLNGRQGETGANGHPLGCAPWLSSAPINDKDRGGYCTGVSIDQLAARHLGDDTLLPSIELGCDADATDLYTSNISWRGPASPMGKEISPQSVFQRLFGSPGGDIYQRSVLDAVMEDASRLRIKLGGIDRSKLDEYLDSVRAIERRIQIAQRQSEEHKAPDIELPAGVPAEFAEHLRLMLDLIVLAFQTDNTRVATFMFNNEAGRRSWPELGIREGHHGLAHLDPRTGEGQDKLDKLKRIDRWYVEQFVYLLQKMESIHEGEGTLLDHVMVLYGSGLAWGRLHNRDNLPILLGGRGGNTIHSGRHVECGQRPLADLFLAMLQRVGMNLERVADSTGPLPLS